MDKNEWCWEEPNGEKIRGPFDSKESCINDIKEFMDITDALPLPGFERQKVKIRIGKVSYLSPEDYVVADLEDMLERMEEDANCDCCFEDSIFDYKKGAEEALKKILKNWAKEYVTCCGWLMDSEEEIEL